MAAPSSAWAMVCRCVSIVGKQELRSHQRAQQQVLQQVAPPWLVLRVRCRATSGRTEPPAQVLVPGQAQMRPAPHDCILVALTAPKRRSHLSTTSAPPTHTISTVFRPRSCTHLWHGGGGPRGGRRHTLPVRRRDAVCSGQPRPHGGPPCAHGAAPQAAATAAVHHDAAAGGRWRPAAAPWPAPCTAAGAAARWRRGLRA